MKRYSVILAFAILCIAQAAHAFEKADVASFCADPERAKPQLGMHFDGKPADAIVLGMEAGTYKLEKSGSVDLYDDGSFLVTFPELHGSKFGTNGDDMMGPKQIGGCSKEQLSELLTRNRIKVPAHKESTP